MFWYVSRFLTLLFYFILFYFIFFLFIFFNVFSVLSAECSDVSHFFILFYFLCAVCCVFWYVSCFFSFYLFSILSAHVLVCLSSPDVSGKYVNITQSDESLLICSLNSNDAS